LASAGTRSLAALRRAAAACTDCDLYRHATQVVFGEGPVPAAAMLIGEQPGDKEDRAGHPFVGPSGALLDGALEEAGIDRAEAYVTNAVKHFKWVAGGPGGKVRIHKSPTRGEVAACSQWWERELALVEPRVVILLGAVATRAVLGASARVTQLRGRVVEQLGYAVVPTIHPAAVLRGDDREALRAGLVADLRVAADVLGGRPNG
jgi:DNA polymerase